MGRLDTTITELPFMGQLAFRSCQRAPFNDQSACSGALLSKTDCREFKLKQFARCFHFRVYARLCEGVESIGIMDYGLRDETS
mmetsp:Transcript_17827/g.31857  ORF Transcript_17827/g.31857 Transcript_17827/m.31857 type:complete len:83 (-) Transcript_17827:23-271(-)